MDRLENDISRRRFLKLGKDGAVGTAIGGAMIPTAASIRVVGSQLTDRHIGNRSARSYADSQCAGGDEAACSGVPEFSRRDMFRLGVTTPIKEELIFRLIPSKLLDYYDRYVDQRQSNLSESEKFLTRKELLVGGLSTVAFGYIHNFDRNGFNPDSIPAQQFAFGAVAWVIQRKRGFASAVSSHVTLNSTLLGLGALYRNRLSKP